MARKTIVTILKIIVIALIIAVLIPALFIAVSAVRPNRSVVADELGIEVWPAVADGRHNSNTDLVFFKDAFWLIHASAPWHFASETTRLVLWKSADARTWEKVAEFANPGEDIRDPKFAVIGGRLILYALKNTAFAAEPYLTVAAASDDGVVWTKFADMDPKGWLFWRPESPDGGKTWYVPAYWHEHGKSALLTSEDGLNWEVAAIIYSGDVIDETAVVFLPDGSILATGRLEVSGYYFGDNRGNTLLATAEPPFMTWSYNHSSVTRLDGPASPITDGSTRWGGMSPAQSPSSSRPEASWHENGRLSFSSNKTASYGSRISRAPATHHTPGWWSGVMRRTSHIIQAASNETTPGSSACFRNPTS
jgi:hypothetical protein